MLHLTSEQIETVTQRYWSFWCTWYYAEGWKLKQGRSGADLPPHMAASWEELPLPGQQWFREHVVLMLHAVNTLLVSPVPETVPRPDVDVPQPPPPSTEVVKREVLRSGPERAIRKLRAALLAIRAKDAPKARVKLESAISALKGGPHERAHRTAEAALRNLHLLQKGQEPRRAIQCTTAAIKRLRRETTVTVETAAA